MRPASHVVVSAPVDEEPKAELTELDASDVKPVNGGVDTPDNEQPMDSVATQKSQ